jgi:hypothetical protein
MRRTDTAEDRFAIVVDLGIMPGLPMREADLDSLVMVEAITPNNMVRVCAAEGTRAAEIWPDRRKLLHPQRLQHI